MTPRDVVMMLVPSPRQDIRDIVAPELTRRPGRLTRWMPAMTRSPRGPYFKKTRSTRLDALARLDVKDLEALDVPFALEDARDLHLQPGGGHLHPGLPGEGRVANPRQHVCNWIGHVSQLSAFQLISFQSQPRIANSPAPWR